MKRLLFLILLFSQNAFAQNADEFLPSFLLKATLQEENEIEQFNDRDFTKVWTSMDNYKIFGIIGEEHQRLKIKFTSIIQNQEDKSIYSVKGKSMVKGNVCDFSGEIIIKEIRTYKDQDFDPEYQNWDSRKRFHGILVASYRFAENSQQPHAGIFEGECYSKWYIDSTNEIEYDVFELMSDAYYNNAFVGTWKSLKTGKSKRCHWGDYRVPLSKKGFDIGAGEFSPSEKYLDKGWKIFHDAWVQNSAEAREKEMEEWWK